MWISVKLINHIHFFSTHILRLKYFFKLLWNLTKQFIFMFFPTLTSKASDYFCVCLSTVVFISVRVKSGGEYYPLKVQIRNFTLIHTYIFAFIFFVSRHNRIEGSSAYTEVQSQKRTSFQLVPSCAKVIKIINMIGIDFHLKYLLFLAIS